MPKKAKQAPVPAFDFEQAVQDARERLARAKEEEETADNLVLAASENDRDLPRYRRMSIEGGHKVAQAEEDLRKAEADLREFGRS